MRTGASIEYVEPLALLLRYFENGFSRRFGSGKQIARFRRYCMEHWLQVDADIVPGLDAVNAAVMTQAKIFLGTCAFRVRGRARKINGSRRNANAKLRGSGAALHKQNALVRIEDCFRSKQKRELLLQDVE